MRKLLTFGRAMRSRGWSFSRERRGRWRFGGRRADGIGIVVAIDTLTVVQAAIDPRVIARSITQRSLLGCAA